MGLSALNSWKKCRLFAMQNWHVWIWSTDRALLNCSDLSCLNVFVVSRAQAKFHYRGVLRKRKLCSRWEKQGKKAFRSQLEVEGGVVVVSL